MAGPAGPPTRPTALIKQHFYFFDNIPFILDIVLQRLWLNNGVCRRRCFSTWRTSLSDTQFRRCPTLLLLATL